MQDPSEIHLTIIENLFGQMLAKYKCPKCGAKWKSKNSRGGPKQCNICLGDLISPYKYRPMKPKVSKNCASYKKWLR